ncbi:MAG: hypothetical protein CMD99_00355 [Gammaproteobacteria bacterium]|nr:hypothetical protein [Gammaproteobacteria bacterium]
MKIILIGLTAAIISAVSFAMNHGHNMDHGDQQIQFKRIESNGITLSNFQARASVGSTKNSGIYGEIRSMEADRLISISSSLAAVAELHEHINDNGVMRMREVEDGLAINPGQPMSMKPGGFHIMLVRLHKRLIAGKFIDLTLEFESGKILDISVPIVPIKKMHH